MTVSALDPAWTSSLYKKLVASSDDPYWVIDPETSVFLDANEASLKQLGYSADELVGRIGVKDVNQSLNSIPAWQAASGGLKLGETLRYVADLQHKDGHLVTCEITLKRMQFEGREVFVAVTRDVSELVAVESALKDREGLMNGILHAMTEGVMVLDKDASCKYTNNTLKNHPGMMHFASGSQFEWQEGVWFGPTGKPLSKSEFALSLTAGTRTPVLDQLLELRTPGQQSYWLKVSAFPVSLAAEEVTVLTITDVSELHKSRQQVRYVSSYDSVTGLPNRQFFQQEAQQRLAHAQQEQTCAGLVYIDLDNFHVQNEILGHSNGDDLLRRVGAVLRQKLPEHHMLARIGGDEFVVLLSSLAADPEQAEEECLTMAQILRETLAQSIQVEKTSVQVTACVGCALYVPQQKPNVQDLIKNAEVALSVAKRMGRDQLQLFEAQMLHQKIQHYDTEHAIRQGLQRGEFELYIQPQWRLSDGAIIGGEGLVRWNHPQRGILSPFHFIDVAEQTGLIVPMGEALLRQACRIARAVQMSSKESHIKHLSVNISAIQFAQDDFYARLKNIVRQEACNPEWLQIEVTESVLMKGRDSMSALTAQLRRDGFAISLDDFGTGFSSLSYLKQLSLDELKIDKSFVDHINSDESDIAIVKAILAMAKAFGFTVVAEGIETVEQARILQKMGCQNGQGYLLSKPMPMADFLRWLQQPESHCPWLQAVQAAD